MEGVAGIMIAVFVLIGVVRCVCLCGSSRENHLLIVTRVGFWSTHLSFVSFRAMQQVYRMTVWLARQLLTRAETAILDVDGNPHYARPARAPDAAGAVPQENLNMRERVTRWLAERAVALDPRRLFGPEGQERAELA